MALARSPPFWDFGGLPFPFSRLFTHLSCFLAQQVAFRWSQQRHILRNFSRAPQKEALVLLRRWPSNYLCPFFRANFLLFLAYGHVWWHGASASCHQTRLYVLTQSNFRRLFLQPIFSSGKYRPHKDTSSGR